VRPFLVNRRTHDTQDAIDIDVVGTELFVGFGCARLSKERHVRLAFIRVSNYQ
jgi:hypothetical protein